MKTLTVIMLIILSMITVSIMPCYADDSVINGCYQKKTGLLRIVTNSRDCLPNEASISWNVQGPAQGPGYVKESVFTGTIVSNDVVEQSVKCDGENDYVTGCSFSINSYQISLDYYKVLMVVPDYCGVGDICQGCRVVLFNSYGSDLQAGFSAHAYCSTAR